MAPRGSPRSTGRAPHVPGYTLGGPLGFGAGGAVWSARDAGGRDVAISVVTLPAGDRGAAQLRRLAALRAGSHPHLPRVLDVVGIDAHRCALVHEVLDGPSLATVVAARGALAAEEASSLLSALASALAHLHDLGVVHGDVAPGNVIVAPGGVPVLTDLAGEVSHERGTPGFVAPERRRGAPAAPSSDVWALAQVVRWAAGPGAPAVLDRALDPEPGRRPAAARLVRAGDRARSAISVPEPAALAQGSLRAAAEHPPTELAPVRRPRGRHRRAARPLARFAAAVAVLLGALAGVVGGGILARTAAEPPGLGGDAARALPELLGERDRAVVAGDASALGAVTVPGGPAAADDAALLADLQDAGATVAGLRTTATEVRVVGRDDAGRVVLEADLAQGAHGLVGEDGRTHRVPAQDARCTRLVLVGPEPWRVESTGPCGS